PDVQPARVARHLLGHHVPRHDDGLRHLPHEAVLRDGSGRFPRGRARRWPQRVHHLVEDRHADGDAGDLRACHLHLPRQLDRLFLAAHRRHQPRELHAARGPFELRGRAVDPVGDDHDRSSARHDTDADRVSRASALYRPRRDASGAQGVTMDDPRKTDTSVFPDPVYKETVLRPLFDGAKLHHVEGFRAIDRAHLVMLAETGILDRSQAAAIAKALVDIDRNVDVSKLSYTGEVEDFFFLVEKELKTRLGPDLAGRLHTARSRNDIDHTLFKLALKERIDVLLQKAQELLEALIAAARRERDTLIVAYTHGQPAQPT